MLGVDPVPVLDGASTRRPVLRFCLDWSEQRHHLGGRLGSAVLDAFDAAGWVARRPHDRALIVTDVGHAELDARLAITLSG